MIQEANTKTVLLLNTASTTNGATVSGSVDCRNFDYAVINVYKSLSTAATAIKVEHSDDDSTYSSINLTSGTDFTAATNGTAVASTIPYYQFNIDTRGLKRYLKVFVTPADTNNIVATATLGRRNTGAFTTGAGAVDVRNILSV